MRYDDTTGVLAPVSETSALPKGFKGTSYASGIRMLPGGRHFVHGFECSALRQENARRYLPQHQGVAILERDQGADAELSQHPGRLRPGSAQRIAWLEALAQPRWTFRPIETHFAADAARGARNQHSGKPPRLRVDGRIKQRLDVGHLDPRIDAGADAAQEKPGRGQSVCAERA